MKNDSYVTTAVVGGKKEPRNMPEKYSSSSGGIVNNRDFIHVVGVDEILDYGSSFVDRGLENVEIEMVRLFKKFQLPVFLS